MNPKNHLSLPLSKQLAHLFLESEWWSFDYDNEVINKFEKDTAKLKTMIPRPQLHDVLEVLPKVILKNSLSNRLFLNLRIDPHHNFWISGYSVGIYFYVASKQLDKSPVQAAGKLAVWCVKNNYLPKKGLK